MINKIAGIFYSFALPYIVKQVLNGTSLPMLVRRSFVELVTKLNLKARQCDCHKENINGVAVEVLTPKKIVHKKSAVIYIHGGLFVACSVATHRSLTSHLAVKAGMKVFAIDYTLAPEAQFPKAAEQALAVYQYLLDQGYDSQNISFAGDSAGGNLALSSLLQAQEKNMPMVGAVILYSPWVDLSCADANTVSDKIEYILKWKALKQAAQQYVGDYDIHDALLSPINASFKNFPPVLMHIGSKEVFLPQGRRLHENLKRDGVHVEFKVYEGMWHVFQMYNLMDDMHHSLSMSAEFLCSYISSDT